MGVRFWRDGGGRHSTSGEEPVGPLDGLLDGIVFVQSSRDIW